MIQYEKAPFLYTVVDRIGPDDCVQLTSPIEAAKAFHTSNLVDRPYVICSGSNESAGIVANTVLVAGQCCKSVGFSPIDDGAFQREYLLLKQE